MNGARIVGLVGGPEEFIKIIRARVAELEITHERFDEIAGWQSGYASKLLADPPIKNLGPMSMWIAFTALGLVPAVVEDAEALKRISARLQKRERPARILANASKRFARWLITPKNARKMASKRHAKLSHKRKKAIARKAIKTRWRKVREAQRRRLANQRARQVSVNALMSQNQPTEAVKT